MKKNTTKRKWRVNLVISYNNQKIAEINRLNILAFLKNLSSIYKLDYAISENHQFKYDTEFENQFKKIEADIFYFRSNANTQINSKELRTTINSLFPWTFSSFYEGVEIFTQLTRVIKEYPFPKEFYRPLKYPYVEFHNNSKKELLIPYDEVIKVIEREQDFKMN